MPAEKSDVRDVICVASLHCIQCNGDSGACKLIDGERGLIFCNRECFEKFEKTLASYIQFPTLAQSIERHESSNLSIDFQVFYETVDSDLPTIIYADSSSSPMSFDEIGKYWIREAIKNPGSLKATARRMGLLKGKGDKLSSSDLATLRRHAKQTGNTTLMKRVNLAKTLSHLRRGGGGGAAKPSASQAPSTFDIFHRQTTQVI